MRAACLFYGRLPTITSISVICCGQSSTSHTFQLQCRKQLQFVYLALRAVKDSHGSHTIMTLQNFLMLMLQYLGLYQGYEQWLLCAFRLQFENIFANVRKGHMLNFYTQAGMFCCTVHRHTIVCQ